MLLATTSNKPFTKSDVNDHTQGTRCTLVSEVHPNEDNVDDSFSCITIVFAAINL